MSQARVTSFFRSRKISDSVNQLKKNDDSKLSLGITKKTPESTLLSTPGLISTGEESSKSIFVTPLSKHTTSKPIIASGVSKSRKRKLSLEGQPFRDVDEAATPKVTLCPARKRLLLDNEHAKNDLTNLKMKLTQSGKLGEVKNIVNKIRESSLKLKLPDDAPKETKEEVRPPAFERFLHLTSKDSFPLPRKFKELSEAFHNADVVVSMKHNKREVTYFSDLKSGVEKLMNGTFNSVMMGQIVTVFPNAYILKESEVKRKKSEGDFSVIPNFYKETDHRDLGHNTNMEMTPSVLLERRTMFKNNLLNIAKKHHEKFLASLKPPIKIPSTLLHRWHPSFPVDSIPDIESAILPGQSLNKVCTKAQDLLNIFQGLPCQKVANALQQVADKNKVSISQTSKDTSMDKLKGVSKSLLEKIRARQAQKLEKDMTCPPDIKYNQMMLSRLPEMLKIVRSYFIAERRAAIRVEDVMKNVSENFHTPISLADTEQHVNLIAMVFPDWLSVITFKKGTFLKIDKDMILEDLISRLKHIVPKE